MYDFIEVYDNVFDDAFCDAAIEKFEKNPSVHEQGRSSSGINLKVKDTTDVGVSTNSDWQQINRKISNATLYYMGKYVQKHSHLLFGLFGTGCTIQQSSTGLPVELTHDLIKTLPTTDVVSLIQTNFTLAPINLQKYEKGKGGYHKWHSEISPTDPKCEVLHRVLFTIFYLNDVDEGGETEFFYQMRSVKPKKGRLVIAPAGFTHTHKGHIPVSNNKYVLTSWIKFKRYEAMVGGIISSPEPKSDLQMPAK